MNLDNATKVTKKEGHFYLKNGEEQKGNIIELGAVARFAESDGKIGALYPSGAGTFRVWKWLRLSCLEVLGSDFETKVFQYSEGLTLCFEACFEAC